MDTPYPPSDPESARSRAEQIRQRREREDANDRQNSDDMRTMLRDEYLQPASPVEVRVVDHLLDSLTNEGLEAFADVLHRLDDRALEAGRRDAELNHLDKLSFDETVALLERIAKRVRELMEVQRQLRKVVDDYEPERGDDQ